MMSPSFSVSALFTHKRYLLSDPLKGVFVAVLIHVFKKIPNVSILLKSLPPGSILYLLTQRGSPLVPLPVNVSLCATDFKVAGVSLWALRASWNGEISYILRSLFSDVHRSIASGLACGRCTGIQTETVHGLLRSGSGRRSLRSALCSGLSAPIGSTCTISRSRRGLRSRPCSGFRLTDRTRNGCDNIGRLFDA